MRPTGTAHSTGCMGARCMALGCVLLHWAHDAWDLAVIGARLGFVAFCAVNLQRIVLAVRGINRD